jgi:hypothetical protein
MPDRRTHRGPHPEDEHLFAGSQCVVLRRAVADLCWLLDRGYPAESSLRLVGDRYALRQRQRVAVGRCAASRMQVERRQARLVSPARLCNAELCLDGYNVLTTVEAALAGGVVLAGRDGAYRDMASMHGSYRKVAETEPALLLVGRTLHALSTARSVWYLDRPVSNSGRLQQMMRRLAAEHGWNWSVELVDDPDGVLSRCEAIVATSDSGILDRCGPWCNLARIVIDSSIAQAWLLDLAADVEAPQLAAPRAARQTEPADDAVD